MSFQHSGYVGFVRPRTLLSFMFSCSLLGYQHDTIIWDTIMYCNVGWDLLYWLKSWNLLHVRNIENCLNIDIYDLIEINSLDHLAQCNPISMEHESNVMITCRQFSHSQKYICFLIISAMFQILQIWMWIFLMNRLPLLLSLKIRAQWHHSCSHWPFLQFISQGEEKEE